MPQATVTPATPSGAAPTTRRVTVGAFLALAGTAKASAIPMPAPDPDAELLRFAAEAEAADVAIEAAAEAYSAAEGTDREAAAQAALDAAVARWDDAMRGMAGCEPQTIRGLAAKARIIVAERLRDGRSYAGDELAASLERDVARIMAEARA